MINKQLAVYVHIPFCVRKCDYCDFLSAPAELPVQTQYIDALCREIRAYRPEQLLEVAKGGGKENLQPFFITSIFFGGGTPSLPPAKEIGKIMDTLREKFAIAPQAEVTIECNPGTVNEEKMACYKMAGINRISLGLQSASDEELKRLGRIHNFEQFMESWKHARAAGFDNINIDLMSGIPGQTEESYMHTLRTVLALKPEHISAYSLIVEEETPFYERYASGEGLPSEESDRRMYMQTKQILKEYGYERYEISNYARPGKECRHNLCYWTGKNYIGFGIGASSYLEGVRYKNTNGLSSYLENSAQPFSLWEGITRLCKRERIEEFMFLGLRCQNGISIAEFERRFDCSYESVYGEVTERFERMGLLSRNSGFLALTDGGIDVSNTILAEFLLDE